MGYGKLYDFNFFCIDTRHFYQVGNTEEELEDGCWLHYNPTCGCGETEDIENALFKRKVPFYKVNKLDKWYVWKTPFIITSSFIFGIIFSKLFL